MDASTSANSRAYTILLFYFFPGNLGILSERPKEYELKRLTNSICDFRELIRGQYVYVDKTAFILKLIRSPDAYFFLARPRRFGKSTFMSTLAATFEKGSRDLFNGTAIHESDYEWPTHPVLKIDFSDGSVCDSPEDFQNSVINALKGVASSYGIADLPPGSNLKDYVVNVISAIHKNSSSRIVILVDEYDYPYTNSLQHPDIAEENLNIMETFYSAVESVSSSIELCFVTGVTRLAGAGLQSWTDMTVRSDYAEVAGFTREEVEHYFSGHIDSVASHRNTSREDILSEVQSHYEGYRFSSRKIPVYNPYTVISFFLTKEVRNFWAHKESPNVRGLVERISEYPDSALAYLHGKRNHEEKHVIFDTFDKDEAVEGLNMLETLMLHAGFLSIKKYDPKREVFKLGLANREVREAFFNSFLVSFGGKKYNDLHQIVFGMKEDLEKLSLDIFFDKMNTYIETFKTNSTDEDDKLSPNLFCNRYAPITRQVFHVVFQSALIIAGIKTDPETEKPENFAARTDYVTLFAGKIFYIIELRLAEDPLGKCIRRYREGILYRNQHVVCVGVKFDSKTARIVDWEAAEFSEEAKELRKLYSGKR